MKISDLFLPKIVRSNPDTRKKAVMGETNTGLLRQVAEKDSHPEVRDAAKERILQLKSGTK